MLALLNKFLKLTSKLKKQTYSTSKTISHLKKHVPTPVQLSYSSFENTKAISDNTPAPLLIMHGLFGSKTNWNGLSKTYHQQSNPQRKIVAMDARNHGDSPHSKEHTHAHMAADIKSLMDQMNIKKASLLGHSIGGNVMMQFALKYPHLVEKLIIAEMSPTSVSPVLNIVPELFLALKDIRLPPNISIIRARAVADEQLSRTIDNKTIRTFILKNIVQRHDGRFIWRINVPVIMETFENMIKFPKMDKATFNGPVLFVGGGSSDFIKKSDHGEIKKLFPQATFKYIDGAGHWIHSDKPKEFLKITLDFLNKKL